MKKTEFPSCLVAKFRHQGSPGTARVQPCDHSEKNYKIKNIKDTTAHFALMRKNSLGTSFICRVTLLYKNSNFYYFLA